MHLNDADRTLINTHLDLLERAGVTLADDVERDDIEDAVADELAAFRACPLSTLAGLDDPDGAPLLRGVLVSCAEVDVDALGAGGAGAGGAGGAGAAIIEIVERYANALDSSGFDESGVHAADVAVVPDPGTGGLSGSVRVRFGEWDVTDINYDFTAGNPGTFELDVLAAALPVDAAAATFPTPDGRDVTLLIPAGTDHAAVDELFAAIETEFDSDLDSDLGA